MSSSLNLAGVFADAIAEHLTVINQFAAQEDAFERAAVRITNCLLAGNKIFGAEMAEAPPTHNTLLLNW